MTSRTRLKVIGLYRDAVMLNGVIVSDPGYLSVFGKPQLFMVFVKDVPGGGGAQGERALKSALASVPTADVQSAQQYKDSIVKQVNQLLNQFEQTQKMMKMVSKGGMQKMLRGMKGMLPGMR